MNNPQRPTDAGCVEQIDCNAAADLIETYWSGSDAAMMKLARSYREGHTQGVFPRAFAAHRIASLALPKVESETWQPIETAPKDGSVILAHWGLSLEGREVVMSVFWADGNWWDSCFDAGEDAVGIPSSWRSLPAPPSTLNTGGTHE